MLISFIVYVFGSKRSNDGEIEFEHKKQKIVENSDTQSINMLNNKKEYDILEIQSNILNDEQTGVNLNNTQDKEPKLQEQTTDLDPIYTVKDVEEFFNFHLNSVDFSFSEQDEDLACLSVPSFDTMQNSNMPTKNLNCNKRRLDSVTNIAVCSSKNTHFQENRTDCNEIILDSINNSSDSDETTVKDFLMQVKDLTEIQINTSQNNFDSQNFLDRNANLIGLDNNMDTVDLLIDNDSNSELDEILLDQNNAMFLITDHFQRQKHYFNSYLNNISESTVEEIRKKIEVQQKVLQKTFSNNKIISKNLLYSLVGADKIHIKSIIEDLETKLNIRFCQVFYAFSNTLHMCEEYNQMTNEYATICYKTNVFLKTVIFYKKLLEIEELNTQLKFMYCNESTLFDLFKNFELLNINYKNDIKISKIIKLRNSKQFLSVYYSKDKKFMIELVLLWLESIFNNETNFIIVELFPEIFIFIKHLSTSVSILTTYKKITLLISLLVFKFHLMAPYLKKEFESNINNPNFIITDSRLLNLFILDVRLLMFNIGFLFLQPELTIRLVVKAFIAYLRVAQPDALNFLLFDDFMEINDNLYLHMFRKIKMFPNKPGRRKKLKLKSSFGNYALKNLPRKLFQYDFLNLSSYSKMEEYLKMSVSSDIFIDNNIISKYEKHKVYLTEKLKSYFNN